MLRLPNEKLTVKVEYLKAIATGLRSEHGENPEYDRALVELVTEAAGLSMEFKGLIARQLQIKLR